MLKEDIKKVNNINLSTIFSENNISNLPTQKNVATYAGGENYYNYYFAYHTIGLNHDTLRLVNNAISSGIGAVAAILSLALPALAPIVSVVAALLIAQWNIWQVPEYDNGNGVVIGMAGFTPTWIVRISPQ
ncbi:hypothetical protein [Spiroplasma endosymbiont of Polydrusus pterygomalis]|uniref:hypothetical protein n=1 Tax=Spiroplasma endosymbiont of Polydrusus pterygomalis TaxID=3139327 RepID=UPI003CCAC4C1